MIWKPSVFGGGHYSGHCSCQMFKADVCHVCHGNGRGSTFVLLVHHSLKRESVVNDILVSSFYCFFF